MIEKAAAVTAARLRGELTKWVLRKADEAHEHRLRGQGLTNSDPAANASFGGADACQRCPQPLPSAESTPSREGRILFE